MRGSTPNPPHAATPAFPRTLLPALPLVASHDGNIHVWRHAPGREGDHAI